MTQQLTYSWTGEEGALLDIMLAPGCSVARCSEYLSRFGIKVIERKAHSDGFSVIIRHPLGALALIEVDTRWIVKSVKKYTRDEAQSQEASLVFRMDPADTAHIKRVVKEGVAAWDIMVGLDQANFKFNSLDNRPLEEGGRVIVIQGKLFGILVLTFDERDRCIQWEILEGEAARTERMAIAARNQNASA